MLDKIKNFLIAIVGFFGLIFCAYFQGKKKGKNDEEIKNMQNVQKNLASATKARIRLNDPVTTEQLHKKYSRK